MGWFNRKFTLVVVCTANITRSAYLHGYMKNYLKQSMPDTCKKIKILSAGVRARSGSSANRVVKHVAKLNGFSLEKHRSNPLSKKVIQQAHVILVMEQWQKDDILDHFPTAKGKTFRMTEYLWQGDSSEISDIPDPTGKNTADFEEFIPVAHAEVDRIFRELDQTDLI